jgi:hypothetical protein
VQPSRRTIVNIVISEVRMKGISAVALIGGATSAAAVLLPGDAGQAWGPFAVLSTGVLLLAAWVIARDDAPATGRTVNHKRAA